MHPDLQQRRRVHPAERSGSSGARPRAGTSLSIELRIAPLPDLCGRYGGRLEGVSQVGRFAALDGAGEGDLAPFVDARRKDEARRAMAAGATLLVDEERALLARQLYPGSPALWVHPFASWAMAKVLGEVAAELPETEPVFGRDGSLGPHVEFGSRVFLGSRVTIGASAVIGSPGFGWALGPDGQRVHIPQLGGVVVEDDVWIGPLVTVDAGTLSPTILRRGVKLDAHVHVGHNCEIGEGTVVAAQSGFAGSVKVGKGVLVGGQVGVADHLTIGDGARIAAKSGVTRDVPGGAVFGGYPAIPRDRWLRATATMYRRGH